jgi:hypothetical protein
MLIFMGSSFTRGGWTQTEEHTELFLSKIVQDISGYTTINLATPCHGSEKYLSSFLYACKHYKPKLFFVETASDRSGGYFYVPNMLSNEISNSSPSEINHMFNTYGIANGGKHDFRLQGFSDPNSKRTKAVLETCSDPVDSKKLLNSFNYVRVFNESGTIKYYKTNNNYVSLEMLSELTNIPVLYYSYNNETQFCRQFLKDYIPTDRYLNEFHKLPADVIDYASEQLNGKHLADDCHHNYNADLLVAKNLIIPFIKNYCEKNSVSLDTV